MAPTWHATSIQLSQYAVRFKLDENLPRSAGPILAAAGHDVGSVEDFEAESRVPFLSCRRLRHRLKVPAS